MPVDVFPEFAPPRVQIQTACLGLTAAEVESLVTIPMEQAFNGIDGLDIMRSKSAPQLSSLELIFKPGTDEMHAAAARPGAAGERAEHAAHLGRATGHDAAAVGDQPGDEDRHLVGQRLARGHVDDGVLEDPGPAAARAAASPTSPIWGERIKAYQVEVEPGEARARQRCRSTT